MTEYPYKWFITNDEEVWHNECDSREEALKYAREKGWKIIGEARHQDFDLQLPGAAVLEVLEGQNEEFTNEDGDFIYASPEQEKDLGDMVSAAIAAWVEKHKIGVKAWVFGDIRNIEHVTGETI